MTTTETIAEARVGHPFPARALASAAVLAALLAGAFVLYAPSAEARALSFSLLIGTLFGVVLQRSRFCFFCNFRDFYEKREPRGVLAILVALAVGVALYHVVFITWMPVPIEGRLPPTAHVGPVSPVLALAALVFGLGMAVSGSCLSAHLYRLGEGSPTAPFALLGAGIGFVAGFLTWNPLFLAVTARSPIVWLPHAIGYSGTLVLSLAVIAILAVVVLALSRSGASPASAEPLSLRVVARRVFVERWPAAAGGAAVGVIAMLAYFRVAPLGVTAELGSLARTAANGAGILPETLYGLDTLRGCATVIKETLLSNNGLFVLGLVGGSFAAALLAGQFKPKWPTGSQAVRGLAGGALMGWGAMTGLGCTVGVLLSGIHAGALAGWVFLAFATAGAALGISLMRRLVPGY
ncbi:MAG: YeeE/YedE family protein [Bauldia sp.]|nr:YeeE/YedE family protein [Bauldia sp.]